MALVNSTSTAIGLISEQDGETFVSDENANVEAEHKTDSEQNLKADHEKKPPEETEEFDHLIPEERAFLIKLKTMFEKIYTEAVPEV